ncbi:MAG TPA: type II secretion system protein GspL [Usitatibacter sp.]|nr:type II secretion system protein GspL [Usitatibacter sp.]
MKLRVFLPASERPDPAARFAWMLFDARGGLLRSETTTLADAPRAETVEAVLPAERVLFARLKLPRVNAATIRELLPFAVEDRLLADPAHIHAVAGATNARGETLVAVVDREWLQAMLDALAGAGLRPRAAWCESALLAGGRGDWHVVCGAARGMLVDDEGVSATFDRSEALPLALRIALDESAARGERPAIVRVHTAGSAGLPDLARWSTDAGVEFARGTQWESIAASQPAAGAIELLQGEFSRRGTQRRRLPRGAIALALVILALQLAFTAFDARRLQNERDALRQRQEAIFRAAFPDARVVVDPELQMARNLADLRRSRGLAAGDEFMAELTRIARGGAARVQSVEYANGKAVAK